MNLPYRVPDNDLNLNISILLVTIAILGKTTRGKLLLNNERLRLCLYLVRNPVTLNAVLMSYDKPSVRLQSHDAYSVASISKNMDYLHDNRQLKILLQHAAALGVISVEYRKIEGFMYELSHIGMDIVEQLTGEYYVYLRSYAKALAQLNSVPTTSLNELVDRGI